MPTISEEIQPVHETPRGAARRVDDQSALLDVGGVVRAQAVVCRLTRDAAVVGCAGGHPVAPGLSSELIDVEAPVGGTDDVRAGAGGIGGGAWDDYGLSSLEGFRG